MSRSIYVGKSGLNNYDCFRVKIEVEAKINDFVPVNKASFMKC